MEEKLIELALVRDQQAALEEKRRALEAELFPWLEAEGRTSVETPYGKFSQKVTKSKEYAEEIKIQLIEKDKIIKEIKGEQDAIKAQAENDDLVTITESVTYSYTPVKI